MIDYTKMDGQEIVDACGYNAAKWAAAFQHVVVNEELEINEGLMTDWFLNAMMNKPKPREPLIDS